MLLTCDIGNTNITLAAFKDDKIIGTYRLTTTWKRTSDEYGVAIMDFLILNNIQKEEIADVIISSVVPKIMHSFTSSIIKYLHKQPIIIGPGVKTGISIKYENPKEIGADRIVDAAGAHYTYGGDILIIDFGTATTFEYVDASGCYYGGCICPGLEISAQALSERAAKLPEIEIKPTTTVIPNTTVTAMQAGVFWGYIGQVEYLIERYKKETGKNLKVIATGGLGRIISKNTNKIDIYDPDLVFKGLKIIYDRNH